MTGQLVVLGVKSGLTIGIAWVIQHFTGVPILMAAFLSGVTVDLAFMSLFSTVEDKETKPEEF